MLSVKDFLEEHPINYIVIELSDIVFKKCGLDILEEGIWGSSNKKGWSQRVDPAQPQMNIQRHVHVAKDKHINTKSQQVAWNQDRTRHDRKSFNANLSGIETAKQIARDALGLDQTSILEQMTKAKQLMLITESVDDVISSSPFDPIYLSLTLDYKK
jgi:hypothetical protein